MRIIYCHQFVFGSECPGFTHPLELMLEVKRLGHQVHIVSGMFSHITRRSVCTCSTKLWKRESFNGLQISRASGILPLTSKGNKVLHHILFGILMFFSGLALGRPDVIIGSSPAPFCALSGFLLSRIRKCRFVLEIRDLWPDDLVQERTLRIGLLSKSLERLMRLLYSRADKVLCVTKHIERQISCKGVKSEKLATLYNSVRIPGDADAVLGMQFREEHNIGSKFVVLYAGNHGSANSLQTVLEAAEILRHEEKILFVLLGAGEDKRRLIMLSDQMRLNNVVFLNPVPKGNMKGAYIGADCCVVPLRNLPIFEGAVPNKLLESMAWGKPVVLSAGAEAGGLIAAAGCGLQVEPENPKLLADALIYLSSDSDRAQALGARGRDFACKHFSHEAKARKLLGELDSVVEK